MSCIPRVTMEEPWPQKTAKARKFGLRILEKKSNCSDCWQKNIAFLLKSWKCSAACVQEPVTLLQRSRIVLWTEFFSLPNPYAFFTLWIAGIIAQTSNSTSIKSKQQRFEKRIFYMAWFFNLCLFSFFFCSGHSGSKVWSGSQVVQLEDQSCSW